MKRRNFFKALTGLIAFPVLVKPRTKMESFFGSPVEPKQEWHYKEIPELTV